ncbi:hypothetical protein ALMA_0040 [Alloscardovia macacae]|uniref:Uncharacterized protein n=1 Tax=Alloscardovia macacae TaxID=1160091 RepID=A0A261F6L8_9BIFI|nr:hypothetical protein ALMA_0040 [Alloscardovia macacae]
MSKKKRRNKDPGPVVSWVGTIVILLFLPLPVALVAGGLSWLSDGIHSVPKEFLMAYGCEAGVCFVSAVVYCWRHRR